MRRLEVGRADLRRSDLREANLQRARLNGARLSGAELEGADLATSLFVIQAQIETARGNKDTALPQSLDRPEHWRG